MQSKFGARLQAQRGVRCGLARRRIFSIDDLTKWVRTSLARDSWLLQKGQNIASSIPQAEIFLMLMI
jgi:hypothetical protein